MPREAVDIEIDGKKLTVTNLDKVLYPAANFTKAAVIDYYVKIAPVLLTHLKKRSLTLKRYPEGVEKDFFYEKKCPVHRPSWVATSKGKPPKGHAFVSYCVVNDVPGLVWVSNLASLELHTFLSFNTNLTVPTMVVFDLDPGPSCNILDCAKAAQDLKKILQAKGLESFAKTSGGKGMHVAVPINRKTDFDATKNFAHAIAMQMEATFPDKITANMRKSMRVGKVFIDWSQNSAHKTTVCAYSLRAQKKPTVSTPVTWAEIKRARTKKDASLLVFTPEEVLKRVKKYGDLFLPVATLKQKLPKLNKF